MKIFRFDPKTGRAIDRHNSTGFVLSSVAYLLEEAIIHCAYLEAEGLIGFHQAQQPQLFLVVQGEGWVRGETPERIQIQAGQGAYWEKGEWHEAGTGTGMTAVIVEAARFDISEWIPVALTP